MSLRVGIVGLTIVATRFLDCASSSPQPQPPPGAATANAATAGAAGSGTGGGVPGSAGSDPSGVQAGGAIDVSEALRAPAGSKVTVRGAFAAMRGPCTSSPPSRSAWHLVNDAQPP